MIPPRSSRVSPQRRAVALRPFTQADFAALMAEVPNAAFLLQWAGPEYRYPLDLAQLAQTLAGTVGPDASSAAFCVVLKERGRPWGTYS